ncbi:lipoprotein [Paucibacter sp. Y2R2-4]|uniref:lipoprotein n=1 Tax=Paucibacter sp. Y2R2-4 TaxID=2893553 RepID=UPI00398CD4C8
MNTKRDRFKQPASVGRVVPTARTSGSSLGLKLACLALLVLSAGCGQKGPLTLSKAAQAAATTATGSKPAATAASSPAP